MFMNAELHNRINHELLMLQHTKKEYTSRLDNLRDCKGVLLRRARPTKHKYYYYAKRPGAEKYIYLKQSETCFVKRVREARFLEEAIRRIDRDIELLESLRDGVSAI